MQYDHILIRYGELALKGNNRKTFLIQLQNNIRHKLKKFENVQVKRTQGRMFVVLHGHDPKPIVNILKDIFGIHSMSVAIKVEKEIEAIKKGALFTLTNHKQAKTFKVSVRRVDKSFPVGSQKMNQVLGAHLLKNTDQFTVDVHDPDVEVNVEIRNEAAYIMSEIIYGSGGLPVGTSGKTLLLLSGGIDSPVAGYLMMKRGVTVEAIHFHSPPFTSDRAKQKVFDIAKQLTRFGQRFNVHLVPFTNLQEAIFKHIPDAYAMTIMRRMMIRIAESVCQQKSILSMTTGESLGQVASQTMESMHAINDVTNYPIIRPLVAMDKHEIVEISKAIETYDISIRPFDDCCTIFNPKQPKTKPKRDRVQAIESQYDFSKEIEASIEGIQEMTFTDKDDVEQFANLL